MKSAICCGLIHLFDNHEFINYNIVNINYKIVYKNYKRVFMLDELFGSKNRERVLQYIDVNGQGYAKEIADFYDSSIDPIKKQLERLESGGILVNQTVGRTRLFMFNPRYAFKDELHALLEKAREYYSPVEQERLMKQRKRPRRTGKPL